MGFGDAGGAIIFWEVGQFLVRLLPTELSADGVQNAQGWQRPTQYLYNSYDADDRRREVTFITEAGGNTIRPYIQKYWDRNAEPTGNESSNDFPVIRYADVLLIYAEAQNELGNSDVAHAYINIYADVLLIYAEAQNELGNSDVAHAYINMVRKRARFNGTAEANAVPDYAGLSKEDFRNAILEERKLEFVAEGQRWFDLVRMKKLSAEVPKAKPGVVPIENQLLFPIPQREIDINPNLN